MQRFEKRLRAQLGGLTSEEIWALALLSSLSEELFFRGAVQWAWGIWPAAILFGLLHLGRDPGQRWWSAAALFSGAALGALVAWRGTLLPAVVAHLVVNAVQLRRLLASPHR